MIDRSSDTVVGNSIVNETHGHAHNEVDRNRGSKCLTLCCLSHHLNVSNHGRMNRIRRVRPRKGACTT